VWRESEIALDFDAKAKFRDMEDTIIPQRASIAGPCKPHLPRISTFSEPVRRKRRSRRKMRRTTVDTMIGLVLDHDEKARFLWGDYARRSLAADKAKALLWSGFRPFPFCLDYYYYTRADRGGAL